MTTKTTHYTTIPVPNGTSKKIAVLTMDNAPVNSLSTGTRAGLITGIQTALKDREVTGIVIRGAGRAFCAGAEITELSGAVSGVSQESLPDTLSRLEKCNVPVVALVHGFALGGGMELSLGCHYRVATEDASFGLPEVNLGVLPGAGGTQRLPRVMGAYPAAEAILSGNPIPAAKAKELGIVDRLIPASADEAARLKAAVEFLLAQNGKTRPVRNQPIMDAMTPEAAAAVNEKLDKLLATTRTTKRRGELAPINIIGTIKAAIANKDNFEEGMREETRLFTELLRSPEARAMQHIFFAERAAAKLEPKYDVKPLPLKQIGIIGAGTMGGGIAMSCADNGYQVVLIDATKEFLDNGMRVITNNYKRSVDRKSIPQKKMDASLARIKPSLDYADLKNCDLVVEAVYEDMKLKKSIFTKLDAVCKSGCILATNTSGLDIDEIASVTKRPEAVVGCHFFSPANVMRLLENVKGAKSAPTTISTAMDFGRRIGKVAILVGNCPGFVGNRMLGPYQKEAAKMILEGIPCERVDHVAKNVIGMNMGPIAMADLVGLDLFWRKRKTEGVANPEKNVDDALCEAGRYGQKNKKGYYSYDEKGQQSPQADPLTREILKKVAKNLRIPQRPADKVSDQEILERLMFPLMNEGMKCLQEGMAAKASDVDVCYCFGYGFPKWRGGPIKYMEEIGFDTVLAGLRKYKRWGHTEAHWEPAKLLVDRVGAEAHGKKLPKL